MAFKIVQTIENNEKFFCTVPGLWVTGDTGEKDSFGKLLWPEEKSYKILKKKKDCAPKDNWETYKCKVKGYFSSFIEAEKECSFLILDDNTDKELDRIQRKKRMLKENRKHPGIVLTDDQASDYSSLFAPEYYKKRRMATKINTPPRPTNQSTAVQIKENRTKMIPSTTSTITSNILKSTQVNTIAECPIPSTTAVQIKENRTKMIPSTTSTITSNILKSTQVNTIAECPIPSTLSTQTLNSTSITSPMIFNPSYVIDENGPLLIIPNSLGSVHNYNSGSPARTQMPSQFVDSEIQNEIEPTALDQSENTLLMGTQCECMNCEIRNDQIEEINTKIDTMMQILKDSVTKLDIVLEKSKPDTLTNYMAAEETLKTKGVVLPMKELQQLELQL